MGRKESNHTKQTKYQIQLIFLQLNYNVLKKFIVISLIPKGSRFTIPTPSPSKNMLMKKRYLGLWDSNVATFLGIFAIQDVDRSTKHVVVVLSCGYIFVGKFVTSIVRAVSIR